MQAHAPGPELQEVVAIADRLHSAAIHLLRWLRIRDLEAGIGPAQLSALSVLVFGGPRSLAGLAKAEQVKPPTMSRIVDGLVRANLATRTKDEQDSRAVVIRATAKGVRAMQIARGRRVKVLAEAVQRLSRDEVWKLREAAELMEQLGRKL